ncbi:MAG: T9SS type A sorting domain-containing protein [Xanthomarina gelatinilytica]|uniref:T9SS type A sorting domain-containing protein n=1 Tax=Xanthomarina gelatinilytica TaxID=1137281 RepID=UPI003A878EE2
MKAILSLIIGLTCFQTQAQTIEKFSIDNGGASTINGNIAIVYTIGEVNVQELNAGNIYLSEGFINSNFGETLSITELNPTENQLLLYPNPAEEVFYVSSKVPIAQLTLYDVSGKQIAKTNATQMKVEHLSAGVYFVKISTETNHTVKRLVVK